MSFETIYQICRITQPHFMQFLIGIQDFLTETLHLELYPRKVIIRKLIQGIDFVGYVLFPHHRLVRTPTKQRMKKRLREAYSDYLSGKSDAKQVDQQPLCHRQLRRWCPAEVLRTLVLGTLVLVAAIV